MPDFTIYPIPLSSGTLGISQLPGRGGRMDADMIALLRWNPDLVLTMTTRVEMERAGSSDLPDRLAEAGVQWIHLPIADFGAPKGSTEEYWPEASRAARHVLQNGGKVLSHCFGGRGRSGMMVMRLMVELGEPADTALTKIRAVRAGAVENTKQRDWAAAGHVQKS
ncbi:phosphatase domain-containing putative toxin [Neptunicoccus cionae]|uniref:phosphatase domain-containing putative toxin n=1 Tax=Neptunicoccus cionae TaxID=2035344 RepID=UPI000C77ADAB|nr:dual specificity protein phosphatase family protein [Amylibacter cionae]PLS21814.1 protein phosphatase [Amylibacter cionae]